MNTSLLPCPVDNRDQISYVGSSVVEPATTSDLDGVARCNVQRHSSTSAMVQLYSTPVQLAPLARASIHGSIRSKRHEKTFGLALRGARKLGSSRSRETTAEPGARAVFAERDWGAARHVSSLHRQFRKKGGVGSGPRRARASGGACRARLGGGSQCPLASPPAQEEVRRRLWAPPGQGLKLIVQ